MPAHPEVNSKPKANRGRAAGPANREALIAAARDVFAEEGLGAPLSAIARRAGVGQGSLYRHFPDRIALAVAVFDDNINDLEALTGVQDAGLSELMDLVAEQALYSGALLELITIERHDARAEHLRVRVETVIDVLLERDRARGRVGANVGAVDVMLAISMLALLLAKTDAPEQADASERAREILRAGLRG